MAMLSRQRAPARALAPRPGRRFGPQFGRYTGLLYVAPATLLLLLITIVPLAYLLYNSLTSWDLRRVYLGKEFIGLENYRAMVADVQFRAAVGVTLLLAVGAVLVELVLGLLLALLFNREFPGKRVMRSLFLLPLITTSIVVGLTWRMLFNTDLGMINYVLRTLHLPQPLWLADPHMALLSIVLTDAWHVTPFVTLMFVAGLQSLSNEPYDAARVDGATTWQQFRFITLPLLRPLIFLAMIFQVTDAIRMFDLIFVMTAGGPANATQTLNMYAYKVGFSFLNMGYGSALAVVLMLVCIGISFVLVRYSGLELEVR